MADISNSAFLKEILSTAEKLQSDNNCQGLNRDIIIVAAMMMLEGSVNLDEELRTSEEFQKTVQLLSCLDNSKESHEKLLQKWRGQTSPIREGLMLGSEKNRAQAAAKLQNLDVLPAHIFLGEILKDETDGIKSIRRNGAKTTPTIQEPTSENKNDRPAETAQEEEKTEESAASAQKDEERSGSSAPKSIEEIAAESRLLQNELKKKVHGQDNAINVFTSGYFQSELQAAIESDRKRPRATFLFAGPPGVGKTFLSEEAAKLLKVPFKRFDMSEYVGPEGVNELAGSDENYKGSAEGLLTGFVNKNPQCILLFDEIEKANLAVIHLFLQILDAGRLRDNRSDKEISFKDTIIIFTTNAGKSLYENENAENLSALHRDVILDTLAKDINPRTQEPYFPAAICSRFASGNVVMFNHLNAHTLYTIIVDRMRENSEDLEKALSISTDVDNGVYTALLLAEGASADARRVKSRAESFFGTELFELYRLIPDEGYKGSSEKIRSIRFTVDTEDASDEIKKLFIPSERIHALVYSDRVMFEDKDDPLVPICHYVHSREEAEDVLKTESIQMILCDLFSFISREGQIYLNLEDIDAPVRDFLMEMLSRYPETPLLITEKVSDGFSLEEKNSYLRRGVRGFISIDSEDLTERIKTWSEMIFQQNCMSELARRNCLVRYETAQKVSEDGKSAEIILFDMKLEKAIKAEDADNVLSLLSTPDLSFEDVYGADSAKNELKFFIQFMKDPQKSKKLAVQPKGILLYGPPGTGKTMLARAFAAESRATFIATEGNRFLKKYVGEGEELIHQVFSAARRYAPSVIFIDEIDVIGSARTGSDSTSSQVRESLLTALFTEMDGFSKDPTKPVFVLAATNYGVEPGSSMSLDPALLRRFDNRILVDLPSKENRKLFLEKETAKKPIFNVTDAGINSIAERSTGMSLALLTNVLNMAVRIAMQNGADSISDDDLEEAFERFNSGEVKKWSPEVTLRTARHESGHTLISWLAGEKPSYVTVVSRGNHGGYMQHADQEDRIEYSVKELTDRIRVSLGGRAAEIVYYGRENGFSTGASSDLRTATALAQKMLCIYGMDETFGMAVIDPGNSAYGDSVREEVNRILSKQLEEAIRLISENRDKMDRLVDALIQASGLKGDEIDRILSE